MLMLPTTPRSHRPVRELAPTTRLLTILLASLFLALTLPLQVTSSSPYLCKCTCFSTNSTILPLLSPVDPSNPCTTCTRQFCLDQKLYGCEGARIENPNADTGTGWEGEVWARCFQRESGKDETIVSFYLFTVVILLLAAALRSHLLVWWEEYQTGGPPALLSAIKASVPGRDQIRGASRGWINR